MIGPLRPSAWWRRRRHRSPAGCRFGFLGGCSLVLGVVGLLACGRAGGSERDWPSLLTEVRERFPDARQMTTTELAGRLEQAGPASEPPPLLLDARAPEEWAVSHLPGAVHAPGEDQAVAAIRAARTEHPRRPVVVYCSVGWRSSDLVERLQARGVENLWNLEGSIFAWANEGRSVVRRGEEVDEVHPFDEDWGRLLERDLWRTAPPGGG